MFLLCGQRVSPQHIRDVHGLNHVGEESVVHQHGLEVLDDLLILQLYLVQTVSVYMYAILYNTPHKKN